MSDPSHAHEPHLVTPVGRAVHAALRESFARFDGIIGTKAERITGGTGAFGALENDPELAADTRLGDFFLGKMRELPGIGRVTVEGKVGDHRISPDGTGLWACVDPLDGSLNFKERNGSLGFPFTAVITILSKTEGATFADIVAAGVVDLRSGDLWIAERQGALSQAFFNGTPTAPLKDEKIDLGRMIVITEEYYPEMRDLAREMFRGEKGYKRSVGSAALELVFPASGHTAGFVCDRQKQHEAGAGYLLAHCSGAWVSDLEGTSLDDVPYVFDKRQTPIIVAGNSALGIDLVERVAKARQALHDQDEIARYGRLHLSQQPQSR